DFHAPGRRRRHSPNRRCGPRRDRELSAGKEIGQETTSKRGLAMKMRNRELGMSIAAVLAWNAVNVVQAAEQNESIEEVIVTGYRQSLAESLDLKRASAAAVDAIFAEDIADFPDSNLAESVQRIPGVAIDRVGGEGRQISIRGLSPEFSRVRINGMEAL